MKNVLSFLEETGTFYLATCDGDQPRVRAFGFVMDCDGKLAFCTSNQKNVYNQMKKNPLIEICALKPEMKWLRIEGSVRFVTTPALQQKALDKMPALKNMYAVGDGKFEVFIIEKGTATFIDMNGSETVPLYT